MSNKELEEAVDKLADEIPNGHLLAATDPCELIKEAVNIIKQKRKENGDAIYKVKVEGTQTSRPIVSTFQGPGVKLVITDLADADRISCAINDALNQAFMQGQVFMQKRMRKMFGIEK